MQFIRRAACSALVLAAGAAFAFQEQPGAATDEIAEAVMPSIVQVEFSLRFDKGEAPQGAGWRYRCPSCGNWHSMDGGELIEQERPAVQSGFVLSPTMVITSDPLLHWRFVERIEIRMNGTTVEATPAAFAVEQNAMILELDEPLQGAAPLAFDAAAGGSLHAVTYAEGDAVWTLHVSPVGSGVVTRETGERFIAVPSACLIVNESGTPVGMSFDETISTDDSWKGSPARWASIAGNELDTQLLQLRERVGLGVPRVALSFRSPSQSDMSMRMMMGGDDESETEWNGHGVVLDDHTVMILANLEPQKTARLERIRLFQGGGGALEAEFVGTLKDYGAFIARTEEPLRGALTLAQGDIRHLRDLLLLGADIRIHGDTRTSYFSRTRIPSFEIGWRRHVYPSIGGETHFVFSRNNELVALPIAKRRQVAVDEAWSYDGPTMTAAADLRALLGDLESHFDSSNIPLSEEQENRLAWLGVELQAMDRDLARINDVAAETQDGAYGAVITYVYEGSPAAEAGLEMGDILLRLHVPGQPKPIDLDLSRDMYMWQQDFPWEYYDEIPVEAFENAPQPWPPVANSFNQKLTKLGFGTSYELELVRDGEKQRQQFAVIESPPYYVSAKKFESEASGLTVKDLTYEVRRYFQRAGEDPGVIISKVEPGSRAAIAGLKPYEIITHINDEPVASVTAFEETMSGGGEKRLTIKRMTRGRIVKIEMPEPAAGAASDDDDHDEQGGDGG